MTFSKVLKMTGIFLLLGVAHFFSAAMNPVRTDYHRPTIASLEVPGGPAPITAEAARKYLREHGQLRSKKAD